MTLHNSSLLLRAMKYCVSEKVNKEKSNVLAKERVSEELKRLNITEDHFLVHIIAKIH